MPIQNKSIDRAAADSARFMLSSTGHGQQVAFVIEEIMLKDNPITTRGMTWVQRSKKVRPDLVYLSRYHSVTQ